MSAVKYAELNAKRLDEEWKEKYPQGMWYIITRRDGTIDYGHLPRRPTSGSQRLTWHKSTGRTGSGGYVGRSFYYVKSHYTTGNYTNFSKKAAKLGLYHP